MPPAGVASVSAPAKINLYLHVTGRRGDGYHLLDSLLAFVDVHDTLSISPAAAGDISLVVDGPFGGRLDGGEDNLVIRAARALAALTDTLAGARLRLTKRLPVAAGLGGGSADAAAALKALMGLWDVRPSEGDLRALALSLGADVPVCLGGRAAFVGGIGEDLISAPALPACSVVLANPGVQLPTAAVFGALDESKWRDSGPGRFDYGPADGAELAAILKTRSNDLTGAATSIAPTVGEVLDALENCDGAMLARMSGSGATCFALFDDPGRAAAATLKLSRRHPGWWVRSGSLEGVRANVEEP